MLLEDIRDLEQYFPFVRQKSSDEWESPSPVDPRNGDVGYKFNGVEFYGEDRLVWNLFRQKFYYRNHPSGNGFHQISVENIVNALGLTDVKIDIQIESRAVFIKDLQPLNQLWTRLDVLKAHLNVDRSYWYKYGFTDETISRFRLGTGTLFKWAGDTPIIPAQVQYLNGRHEQNYYVFARSATGWVSSSGSKTQIIWLIQDNDADKRIAIVEGPKDVLTAWQMGYKNVACYMGQGGWSLEKSEYISSLGYKEVYVVTDNDEAGEQFRENCKKWFSPLPLKLFVINWQGNSSVGYDLNDFYLEHGEESYTLLQKMFDHIKNILRSSRVKELDDSVEIPNRNFLTLEEVRGDGENSIKGALTSYLEDYEENRGSLLLMASPPGTGKTHTSIQVVEDQADIYYKEKLDRYKTLLVAKQELEIALSNESEELERQAITQQMKNLDYVIDNFDWSTIAWYGQYKQGYFDLLEAGANEERWFNFEGRHDDNCDNISVASELGRKNHDIFSYCNTLCPFREKCRKQGYLSQYEKKRKYPIVFYRHQHLISGGSSEKSNLVVIDENPHGVVDGNYIEVLPQHLNPSAPGWDLDVEETRQVYLIEVFIEALKQVLVMSFKDQTKISGVTIYRQVDERIQEQGEGLNLKFLLENIDFDVLNMKYQPSFLVEDEGDYLIPLRCVPQIFQAMVREVDHYPFIEGEQWNSVFHLEEGTLRFYPTELPNIRRSTPVICLDATPEPSITKLMFNRNIDLYKPDVKNDNTTTTVILGSDYTKGTRFRYYQNKLRTWELKRGNSGEVPKDLVDNPFTQRLMERILFIKEKHDKLLVITFKELRILLEDIFKENENLVFDHYGNVRGTNRYEDFEAILLIGAYRIPYDVIRERAQVWLSLAKRPDLIPEETSIKVAAYDNTKEGHTYRSFDHQFADSYVNFIEEGEVRQSAARIRAHTSKESKSIYIMANRPLLEFVDTIVTDRDFFKESTKQTKTDIICEYVRGLWEEGVKTPTYKELTDKFEVSNSVVAYALKKMRTKK